MTVRVFGYLLILISTRIFTILVLDFLPSLRFYREGKRNTQVSAWPHSYKPQSP